MSAAAGRGAAVTVAVAVTGICLVSAVWALPHAVDLLGKRLNTVYVALDMVAVLAAGLSVAWWGWRRGPGMPFPPLALFVIVWPLYWYLLGYPHPVTFLVGVASSTLLVPLYMHAALTFPDGRTTCWERRFLWAAYTVPAVFQLGSLLTETMGHWTGCDLERCAWALAPELVDDRANGVAAAGDSLAVLALSLLFIVLLVLRWGRLTRAAARRYRWMGLMSISRALHVCLMAVLYLLGSEVDPDLQSVLTWAFTAGIAVVLVVELRTDRWVAPQVVGLVEDVERGTPVRAALSAALEDPQLTLGYRAADGRAFEDEDGRALPEVVSGRLTTYLPGREAAEAILVHDPAVPAAAVHAVGPAVLLARRNHLLERRVREQLAEVRASRARLADAADVERRRIERDLHDGAQQHLLGLGLGLRILRQHADAELAAELDDLLLDLDDALSELRNLARGIHPSLLDDTGLAGAVPALVRSLPVPVEVQRLPQSRLAPSVETTAYFVIAEATANAAKHARAGQVRVSVRAGDDSVLVEVTDDGCGGARTDGGTGLRGLRDRVEALGGRLAVDSPDGRGTSIRAEIPCG